MGKLASMTGFARHAEGDERFAWDWDLRSYNSRSLKLRFLLSAPWDRLEPQLRERVTGKLERGALQAGLQVRAQPNAAEPFKVDRELLQWLVKSLKDAAAGLEVAPPRLDGLLSLPGVLVLGEAAESDEERQAREGRVLESFDRALAGLVAAREEEGARLEEIVERHLAAIERLAAAALAGEAARPAAFRARLEEQLRELLAAQPSLSEERLAQEAALLATKADVREEIDRLNSHAAAARELLAAGGAIGRKLDFLCQEFNREANTLCSKSADIALTRIGLELKSTVEQLREQVQNLE